MAEVNDNSSIQLFEDQKIRTAWDAEKEEWYFSIVDVVAVLTEQKYSLQGTTQGRYLTGGVPLVRFSM